MVEADETTTQVGVYDNGLAVSSKNGEPQGEFTVLTKKAVVENGEEMYELKIQFNNTGNHPVYGESFTKYDGTEVTFGKFGGTNNAKLYVDTYNEDMSSIGREVVDYKEFVALEGNSSKTPGFTATIRVPANTKYATIDYVYNSDHTYSAGYWVVERLEDEPLFKITKVDGITKTPIPNAKFVIYEIDENYNEIGYAKDINENEVGTITENVDAGSITFPLDEETLTWSKLEDGTYKSGGETSNTSTMTSKEFTIEKSGSISFDWAVSSESASYDYVYYTIKNIKTNETLGGTSTKIGGNSSITDYNNLSFTTIKQDLE